MKTCLAPAFLVCATLGLAAPAGAAVHVRGDFNGDGRADLAIGAPDDSVAGNDLAGAVNVLYGSRDGLATAGNRQLTQDTPGMTGSAEPGDRFGTSLAVGDIDGDGFSDLAVGTPAEGVSAGDGRDRREVGSVTVVYGSEDGLDGGRTQVWMQDTPGIDGQAEAGDRFGHSVAVGDFDGNGFDDLASGVPGESVGDVAGAGAVNVIYGSRRGLRDNLDDLWTRDAPGVKGTAAEEDRFGHAVAAVDVSSNNFAELIVGVPGADVNGEPEAGAVNVLYGRAGGVQADPDQLWTQDSRGVRGVAAAGDRFGSTLAVGDFDGDRVGDLAVGVPHEAVGGASEAGAVNVIYGTNAGLRARRDQLWTQDSDGIKEAASGGDRFGVSLAAGDFSRNGADDLAIGVPGETLRGEEAAGAVNVLYGDREDGLGDRDDQLWHQGGGGLRGRLEGGDLVGAAAATGDFDGDGDFDLAVGSAGDTVAGNDDAGAVTVVHGSRTGLRSGGGGLWTQNSPDVNGRAAGADRFGSALASGHAE